MLLKMAIENWMSFRDRTEFSMIASRERQHGERLTQFQRLQTRILPVAMIFGGNAAGKTNFFRALGFAQDFIVDGNTMAPDEPIPVVPFLLDEKTDCRPSSFSFTILVGEDVYEYSFTANAQFVISESLQRLTAPAEGFSFTRSIDLSADHPVTKIEFGKAFQSKERQDLLNLVFQATRPNRLFLTSAVAQNIEEFRPVYDWFRQKLYVVSPTAHYRGVEKYADTSRPTYDRINQMLAALDTGISHLKRLPCPPESIPVPPQERATGFAKIQEGETVRLRLDDGRLVYLVSKIGGKILTERLVSCHRGANGMEYDFNFGQESDGTRRILDLLPAFIGLERTTADGIFFIDEIDRCLHALVTRRLLEAYLANRSPTSRTQLIATTQDDDLLDQSLFRRDELWTTERHEDGASTLAGICEFHEARYDKDIRKSYLQGRMGGIPVVGDLNVAETPPSYGGR